MTFPISKQDEGVTVVQEQIEENLRKGYVFDGETQTSSTALNGEVHITLVQRMVKYAPNLELKVVDEVTPKLQEETYSRGEVIALLALFDTDVSKHAFLMETRAEFFKRFTRDLKGKLKP